MLAILKMSCNLHKVKLSCSIGFSYEVLPRIVCPYEFRPVLAHRRGSKNAESDTDRPSFWFPGTDSSFETVQVRCHWDRSPVVPRVLSVLTVSMGSPAAGEQQPFKHSSSRIAISISHSYGCGCGWICFSSIRLDNEGKKSCLWGFRNRMLTTV